MPRDCRVCRTIERGGVAPYDHEHFNIRLSERTTWTKDGAHTAITITGGLSKKACARITARMVERLRAV